MKLSSNRSRRLPSNCPQHLRSQYLHHLAKLLPHDFSDADVWRAAHKAVHEVMHAATRVEQSALEPTRITTRSSH
jgi:hypothetical protein